MIESLYNNLGNYYPFFLNNYNLTDQHYLYQIYSPGLSENLNPYISMIKVSEKTYYGTIGKETDILKLCIDRPKKDEPKQTPLEYLENMFKDKGVSVVKGNNKAFPMIELIETKEHESLEIPKTLVINLRDTMRWKFYRFYQDRFVDILWTPKEFALFQIKLDDEFLYLEPKGLYDNRDVLMQDPIKLPNYRFHSYKWPKDSVKATDLNRFVRKLEWYAFDRQPFT